MNYFGRIWIWLLLIQPVISLGQENVSLSADNETKKNKDIYGFIRGGLYTGIDQKDKNKPYVSSAFSDFALKIETKNGLNFKAFADLRFRYGVEFQKPVNRLDIREAYAKINGKKWDITAGQRIIKWGRTDFTNPTSKLRPQNLISRSPDREDMDMGNLLASINWYPSGFLNIEAVAIPFYRSSVLIIDPVPLPENVTINQINSLITGKEMFSYGFKADLNLKGIDLSISWFEGYDPMPGTALTGFNLDLSGPIPVPFTQLTIKPYKNRVIGMDFETTAGSLGIRGEAAWSVPDLLFETHEYVPMPEAKWVAGTDWSSGIWHFTLEYSGKYIPDFVPSLADPVIGTEPDYSKLAEMMSIPGFDLEEYVRQQVGAFNRLYNYQLKRSYHSFGMRSEAEMVYGKLLPSIFTLYNFTSRDLLIIPEIKIKPADGLTITAGAEFYYGRSGSLFGLVNDFMNSVYLGLKVDF